MNFIALFFLCVRMFHFIHSRRIAYLLQRFSRILDERRANPGRKQVIVILHLADAARQYLDTWFSAARYCNFGIARYSRPYQRCL